MSKLVTATTRVPREGEREGVDHVFIANEEFRDLIQKGEVLEHVYFEERDVYYGTLRSKLEKQSEDSSGVLAEMQIIGARYLKKHYNALTIFIEPESLDILEERIRSRSVLPEEEIAHRLEVAQHEMEHEAPEYDIRISNKQGKLQETVDEIIAILNTYNISCETSQ